MRLIDADELRRKMCYKCIDTDEEMEKGRVKWDSGLWIRYKVFEDAVALAPTIEAEPTYEQVIEYCRKRCLITVTSELFNEMKAMWTVKHGHWIGESQTKKCSVCGNYLDFDGINAGRGNANYCPNCGAKMDEKVNS